jgi:hypothetical protein
MPSSSVVTTDSIAGVPGAATRGNNADSTTSWQTPTIIAVAA